ncbi:MAG: DUF2163 domain-containing protein [Planktomarina sp.]
MSTQSLHTHLASGVTTVARAWAITRKDGVTLGFTDCDLPLAFDGYAFEAAAGMTARAVHHTSGLSVDNTEALGVLTDDRIAEADILAGRFDGAVVHAWLVNWRDTTDRKLIFKGTLGEIRRQGGGFEAELRGLTEALNAPQGRVYQKPCTAVLGDGACGFDTSAPGFSGEGVINNSTDREVLRITGMDSFADGWFARGRLEVISGAGAQLLGWIKADSLDGTDRMITLWEPLRAELAAGDRVRLIAGCDKRKDTCKSKFDNLINFQGFPFIPGEDWLTDFPKQSGDNTGEALL